MKKCVLTLCCFLLLMALVTDTVLAEKLTLGIEAGYFMPTDSDFNDAYGSGGMTYGVNAGYKFFEPISIQAAFDMYSGEGKTAITQQDISIDLKNLRIGGYYHFNLGKFLPRIGAGAVVSWIKEKDPFGGTNKTQFGWFAGAGLDIPVVKNFLASLDILYHDVKLTGDFGSEAIGGISILLGLKLGI